MKHSLELHRHDDDGAHMYYPQRHKAAKRRFYRAARRYMNARFAAEGITDALLAMEAAYLELLDVES